MSDPVRTCPLPAEDLVDPELLEIQRRAAEHGLHLRLPTAGPGWELPDLIEVEGELPSEALIRLRRANRP